MTVVQPRAARAIRLLTLAAAVLSAAGCATMAEVKSGNAAVRAHTADVARAMRPSAPRLFEVSPGFTAANRPLPPPLKDRHGNLPAIFAQHVVVQQTQPMGLIDLARRINEGVGIQVVLDHDLLQKSAPATAATPLAPSTTALPPLPPGVLPVEAPSTLGALASADQAMVLPRINYRGTLKGLLNMATSSLGLSWRWTGRVVRVFRYETRTFTVDVINSGTVSSNASMEQTGGAAGGGGMMGGTGGGYGGMAGGVGGGMMGGAMGAGGGGGGSMGNVSSTNKYNPWKDIEKAVNAIVKPTGGSMVAAPSAGLLIVRAPPPVLRKAAEVIRRFNQLYTAQVLVNIQIYAIQDNREDNNGINWNVLWNDASRYGVAFTSPPSLATSGGLFTFTQNSGHFQNSTGILNLLSSTNPTSLVLSKATLAMNGQTVPITTGNEVFYIASSGASALAGSIGSNIATTTLSPGVINEGTSLSVTPRILPNGKVLLQFNMNISSIESIKTYSSGTAVIQLPNIATQSTLQEAAIPSGVSVGLADLAQVSDQGAENGIFSPHNWVLGGSETAQHTVTRLVIVATPVIVNLSR